MGVAFNDMVHYQMLGNQAVIQIDLHIAQPHVTDNSKPDEPQNIMTPEEEFRQKYPNIKITRPELFKLVGCMAEASPNISDKDMLIDAIEAKYRVKENS